MIIVLRPPINLRFWKRINSGLFVVWLRNYNGSWKDEHNKPLKPQYLWKYYVQREEEQTHQRSCIHFHSFILCIVLQWSFYSTTPCRKRAISIAVLHYDSHLSFFNSIMGFLQIPGLHDKQRKRSWLNTRDTMSLVQTFTLFWHK